METREFKVDGLAVKVFRTRREMGDAAGKAVALRLRTLLATQSHVRMIFAAAPSQQEVLDYLVRADGINWKRVTAFHMDEYIGLPEGAEQSFGLWLKEAIFKRVRPGEVHYVDGRAKDVAAECARYSALLKAEPVDLCCLGIGENGHIAFNDPPVADFKDPALVKAVELDAPCRTQQVNDGCFPSFDAVPKTALTLTIPALMSAKELHCVVPGPRKAAAVKRTLQGPVSTECPATILRTHPAAVLYLDDDSAKLADTAIAGR
jgi:glucosamine-6-phosphate deaminase